MSLKATTQKDGVGKWKRNAGGDETHTTALVAQKRYQRTAVLENGADMRRASAELPVTDSPETQREALCAVGWDKRTCLPVQVLSPHWESGGPNRLI